MAAKLSTGLYFTHAWEQRTLGEITTKIGSGKTPKGGSAVYLQTGIPLLRSQNIVNDEIDFSDVAYISDLMDAEMSNSRVCEWDILLNITGASIGRSAVYRFSCPANVNQHVCIIRPESGMNANFIQLNLSSQNGQQQVENNQAGGGREGLNFQQIAKITFSFPSTSEQTDIGNFFRILDDAITLHKRKLDGVKELKRGYLQRMFPQAGENVPRVRFAGFNEPWQERTLGDVVERVTRKNKGLKSTLTLTISAQHGLIAQKDFFDKDIASKDVSNYYLVKNGEFAYNKSYSNGYPWGAVKRLDKYEMGVLSTLYIVFKPTNIDSEFLVQYYETTNWHNKVAQYAAEGARNHGLLNIATSDFFETVLAIPTDSNEQATIGNFFRMLDGQIIVQEQKLNQLKQLKSAYLQNMFI